jgi:hypothetical protein
VSRLVALGFAAVGCSGTNDPPDSGSPADPCAGDGEPAVTAGIGPATAFVPWSDGDAVQLIEQGGWGFELDLETTGLDATASLTVFVRYSLGADTTTEDVGATLMMLCDDAGVGWAGVFVGLDDALQTTTAVDSLDGEALHLTVTASDQDEAASQDLELVLAAP